MQDFIDYLFSHDGVIIALVIITVLVFRFTKIALASRLTKKNIIKNAPLLLSYYTKGRTLLSLSRGKFGSLSYNFLTFDPTTPKNSSFLDEIASPYEDTVICLVNLPFKSDTHLVGLTNLSKKEIGLHEFLASRNLEKIELEGNFPSYVSLFAPPGNQFNARYLLDPKAMAFIADFCKSHHWEIVGGELYFVANKLTEKGNTDDPTPYMTADVERFVEEIKPALVKGD